jgi:hypothetical protein
MFWKKKFTGVRGWSIVWLLLISWVDSSNFASAQTIRAVYNEPSAKTYTSRNGRVRLDDCTFYIGYGVTRRYCHSLTYVGGDAGAHGYFDAFDAVGEGVH